MGRALSVYVKHSRPRSTAREVFLRHFHPVGTPLRSETVRGAMREAYRRAGLSRSWTGTHVLRRTFATRLLRRGAGLREIREGRRNVGALKLSNLLQLDRFEEDLFAEEFVEKREE